MKCKKCDSKDHTYEIVPWNGKDTKVCQRCAKYLKLVNANEANLKEYKDTLLKSVRR